MFFIFAIQIDVASTKGVSVETNNGRKEVTPAVLWEAAEAFRPNFVVGLADEVSKSLCPPPPFSMNHPQ